MIFKKFPTSSDISISIISKLPPISDEDKQNLEFVYTHHFD